MAPHPSTPYRFTALGHQQLTCGTAAAGTVLTLPTGRDGRPPLLTRISVTSGTVRYLDTGGTPTATLGPSLTTTNEPLDYYADPSKLRFIGLAAAGTVDVLYYG